MVGFSANYRTLCELTDRDLALYFLDALGKHTEHEITSFLVEAVECEGIPPSAFGIWLSIAKSQETLVTATQLKSRFVRRCAIGRIGKALKSKSWHSTWQSLGGVDGALRLFEHSSIEDVEYLVKALRASARSAQIDPAKQNELVALFKALLPQWFPESTYQARDQRRLSSVYGLLLPVCPPTFIVEFLNQITSSLSAKPPHQDAILLSVSFEAIEQSTADRLNSRNDSKLAWIDECLPKLAQDVPPLPSLTLPGWSISMEFSWNVLRAVTRSGRILNPMTCLTTVIMPLLRRLRKRKANTGVIADVLDVALGYATNHQSVVGHHMFCGAQKESFYSYVCRCWSRWPDVFAQPLERLLQLIGQYSPVQATSCHLHLLTVPKFRRYDLLSMLGIYALRPKLDLKNQQSLGDLTADIVWAQQLFFALPETDGRHLLDMLANILQRNPRLSIDSRTSLKSRRSEPENWNVDVPLIRLMLSRGLGGSLETAKRLVEEKKKLSVRSREQTDRCWHAEAALLYSIASGDLWLYEATIEWSRRYIRDPVTAKNLFGASITHTEEGIALLSSIGRPYDGLAENQIKPRVDKANDIILNFLELACASIREPTFQAWHWHPALKLFAKIVSARLHDSKALQQHFKLSDSKLYDIVWKGTLAMLLKAESIGLSTDYEDLQFNSRSGPARDDYMIGLQLLDPASARFFDDLAKERNSLWERKRALDQPSTAVLEAPWPRGLPIQDLVPFETCMYSNESVQLPYLTERATSVVFMAGNIASRKAPGIEARKNISSFSNDYNFALGIVIHTAPSGEQREKQMNEAWDHAISHFSNHMSPSEASRRWSLAFSASLFNTYLQSKLASRDPDTLAKDWKATIPDNTDEEMRTEWNPAERRTQATESRIVDAKTIDCVHSPYLLDDLQNEELKIELLPYSPPDFWDLYRLSRESDRSGEIREAYIAASLLSLDAAKKGPSQVLSTAFPENAISARLPPLYLDGDFLNERFQSFSAFQPLGQWLPRVPSALLRSLAQGTFDVLMSMSRDEPESKTAEEILYRTLSLLVKSNRPEISLDLVCSAIVDRPDSSSWHRHILHRGLLRSLSPAAAMGFVQDFASRCIEPAKTSKTPASKPGDAGQQSSKASPAKITTVKMLAQLLISGDIFSVPAAIGMLKDILMAKSHIDVRVAAVSAAIGLIETTPNKELSSSVLSEVESFLLSLVPIIGSLSERDGPRAEMWTTSFIEKDLPEVDSESPLYDVVRRASMNQALPESIRRTIEHTVLVPALDESIKNNKRWIELFVEKHALDFKVAGSVIPPKEWGKLNEITRNYVEWLPEKYLDLHQAYFLSLLKPTPVIRKAVGKVQQSSQLRNTKEGAHFLAVFSHDMAVQNLSRFSLQTLLNRHWTWPEVEGAVRLEKVKQYTLQMAKLILEADDAPMTRWKSFVGPYTVPQDYGGNNAERYRPWKAHIKPVIREIVTLIESYRTEEWQKDPARRPRRLPPSFPLRLMLLSYPYMEEIEDVGCQKFAAELHSCVEELAGALQPSHSDFEELKQAAKRCSAERGIELACVVGNVSEDELPSAPALLRVELADSLLRRGRADNNQTERCQRLIDRWFQSRCEAVRERAWALRSDLKWLREEST